MIQMSNHQDSEPSGKIFTLEQAGAMLPLVRAIVKDMAELARDVIDRRERLAMLRDGRPKGQNDVYQQELAQIDQELQHDTVRLREYVEELQALGVEPKNGPEGIVDFRCLMEGRVVYLCWKLGEPTINHWHELEGGISGRRELPAEWFERPTATSSGTK